MGLAFADELGVALPLEPVDGVDFEQWNEQLAAVIEKRKVHEIIVGYPLNMDGTESDISKRVMKFARQIEGRYQRMVTLVDERLSSREAKAAALASGHNGDFAAKPIDDEAAAIILTTWLNEQ